MPGSLLSWYSLRNGNSVSSRRVTENWIGVSFFFSSSSLGRLKTAFDGVAVAWAIAATGAAALQSIRAGTAKKIVLFIIRGPMVRRTRASLSFHASIIRRNPAIGFLSLENDVA